MTDQTTETKQETKPDSTTVKTTLLNQKEGGTKPEVKPEEKPGEAKKPDREGAPETYADYTMPEGYTLDPTIKGKADALFKNMGLSQEHAQQLVDFYRETTTEAFQQPFNAFQEMVNDWGKEAENHPDLKGKLGPGKEVNVRIAKALDALNDPALSSEFRDLMDLTGAGNHPAFIRAINAWSKLITEGGHVSGNGPTKASQSEPGKGPPTAAAALWPKLPSAQQ